MNANKILILIILTMIFYSPMICKAIDVELTTNTGNIIQGVLSGVVVIEGKYGTQKIPTSEISKIVMTNKNIEHQHESVVLLINSIFAAKGNEDDKDGFYRVDDTGSFLPENVTKSQKLPASGISEIQIQFWGGNYANTYGVGYVNFEFYDDTQEKAKITSARLDIDNIIKDPNGKLPNWAIYKSKEYLKQYNKIIKVENVNLSRVKVFVNPGDWAVVMRDIEITLR